MLSPATNLEKCLMRGRLNAVMALSVMMTAGCADDVLVSISTVTDEFLQNSAAEIDVLWVVDNSESMSQEQSGLGQSFQSFITNLLESDVDYHIGVVSSDIADGGRLHMGSSSIPFIHPEISNPTAAFIQNIAVGIRGSRIERSFESMALTLGKGGAWKPGDPVAVPNTDPRPGRCGGTVCQGFDKACSTDGDCGREFLREEASLFVIMVSDEDDKSFGPVGYYRRLLEGYKGPGNESRISVSAIVGDPGGGCSSGRVGDARDGGRYIDLAGQSGGIWTSICDDFSDSLRELSITAAGLKSIFELSATANTAASIECGDEQVAGFCVRVDGVPVDARRGQGWQYLKEQNAIAFGVNDLPGPQSKITVEYQQARGF